VAALATSSCKRAPKWTQLGVEGMSVSLPARPERSVESKMFGVRSGMVTSYRASVSDSFFGVTCVTVVLETNEFWSAEANIRAASDGALDRLRGADGVTGITMTSDAARALGDVPGREVLAGIESSKRGLAHAQLHLWTLSRPGKTCSFIAVTTPDDDPLAERMFASIAVGPAPR
jgi:hypothetical protein